MEHFLHVLKLDPLGGEGLKETHSLVRDRTDRKQVNNIKQNKQTQNE